MKLKIDDSTVTNNTATEQGGGIHTFWLGGGNRVELFKTKVDFNRAINGVGGGMYCGANTTIDGLSSVSNNKSGDRKGLGIFLRGVVAGQVFQLNMAPGFKANGNQYFPPPVPIPEGGVQGMVGLSTGTGFVDDGLPFAVYVEEGAELILQGVEISGNDGHGVYGYVISLGNNYVENSLTTSSGWIASDTVT